MGRLMFLLIFGLAGAGSLISLGVWQVQRLAWKEGVLTEIAAKIEAEPVSLPMAPVPDADRYLPVTVSGAFLRDEIHVLVSVKRVGPGFRIIAPFETDDGRRILIDRGFVPDDQKRSERETGSATVTGNLHWPREIDRFTPGPDINANTWFARDVSAMAAHLATSEVLVVAKSETDPNVTPLPVDTTGIPNDHLQYAITWFSLAAIWIMMTALFLWRSRVQQQA